MFIRIQFCFHSFYPGTKRLQSLGLHEPYFFIVTSLVHIKVDTLREYKTEKTCLNLITYM